LGFCLILAFIPWGMKIGLLTNFAKESGTTYNRSL